MTPAATCCIHGCPRKPAWQIEETYGRKHLLCGRHVNGFADGIYGRTRESVTQRPWPPPKQKPVPRDPPEPTLYDTEET